MTQVNNASTPAKTSTPIQGEDKSAQGKTSANGQEAPSNDEQAKIRQAEEVARKAESENVRRLQQALTGKINELTNQNKQLLSRIKELETADLDDDEKVRYSLKELQQELSLRDQRLLELEQERQDQEDRRNTLDLVSQKTGAPYSKLLEATSAQEAWTIGIEHMRGLAVEQQQQEQTQRRIEANQVDLGSGSTPTTQEEVIAALDEAKKARDPLAYTRLLRIQRQLGNQQ